MRCFNFKYHCVMGHLMLVGALSMPSSGMATEALPEGAASVTTTLQAIVASPSASLPSLRSPQGAVALSVSVEQWNALCMEAQVSREGRSSASCARDTCASVDGAGCRERPQVPPQHSGTIQRSGETIVTLPGLLAVMQNVVQQPSSGVALHYPEDERGEVWVKELRDWLVALGLSSNRIQLMAGSDGDVIKISQVVMMQGSVDGEKTPTPVITEPFQINEVTDAVNGVEIP